MALTDDELQSVLAEGLAVTDAVSPRMVDVAKGLFTWRDVDALIAELTFDSAINEMAGVRGAATARTVSFQSRAFEIDNTLIDIVATPMAEDVGQSETNRLLVHIDPAAPGVRGVLRHLEGEVEQHVGAHGELEFTDVPSGPVRLSLHTVDGVVTTEVVSF